MLRSIDKRGRFAAFMVTEGGAVDKLDAPDEETFTERPVTD